MAQDDLVPDSALIARLAALRAALAESVLDKLAVANPNYVNPD